MRILVIALSILFIHASVHASTVEATFEYPERLDGDMYPDSFSVYQDGALFCTIPIDSLAKTSGQRIGYTVFSGECTALNRIPVVVKWTMTARLGEIESAHSNVYVNILFPQKIIIKR